MPAKQHAKLAATPCPARGAHTHVVGRFSSARALGLVLVGALGVTGCKENAPLESPSSRPELRPEAGAATAGPTGAATAGPDTGSSAPAHAPPAKAVEPLAGEDTFPALQRLTFEGHVEQPRFTSDGKIIAFVYREQAGGCPRLALVDLEGRPLSPASVRGLAGLASPASVLGLDSFDGRGDRFVAARGPVTHEACRANLEPHRRLDPTTQLVELGKGLNELAPSAGWDATPAIGSARIVFSSTRSGDPELWSVALDGSDLQRLTTRTGLDAGASFAPNGEQLVWTASRPQGVDNLARWASFTASAQVVAQPTEIRTMRADGLGDRPLTAYGANTFAPRIDGEGWLWFTSNLHDAQRRDFDVYRKAPVGDGPPQRMTLGPGFDGQVDVSADGTQIVFVSDRGGDGLALYVAELAPKP